MTKKSKFGGVPLEDNESTDKKKRGFFINSSGWLFSFSLIFLFISGIFDNDAQFEDENGGQLLGQQLKDFEDSIEKWQATNRYMYGSPIFDEWHFTKGSNIVTTPSFVCKTKAKLYNQSYFEPQLQSGDVIFVDWKRPYFYEIDTVQYHSDRQLEKWKVNRLNGTSCSDYNTDVSSTYVLGMWNIVLTEPADFDAKYIPAVSRVNKTLPVPSFKTSHSPESVLSQLNVVPSPVPAIFFGYRLLEGYYMPLFYFSWADRSLPLFAGEVGYYFLPTSIQGTIFFVIFLVLFTIALRGNFKSSGRGLGLIQSILQILVFVPFSAYLILVALVMAYGAASTASKVAKKVAKSPGASAGIGAFLGASLGKKETRGKPKGSKNNNP